MQSFRNLFIKEDIPYNLLNPSLAERLWKFWLGRKSGKKNPNPNPPLAAASGESLHWSTIVAVPVVATSIYLHAKYPPKAPAKQA